MDTPELGTSYRHQEHGWQGGCSRTDQTRAAVPRESTKTGAGSRTHTECKDTISWVKCREDRVGKRESREREEEFFVRVEWACDPSRLLLLAICGEMNGHLALAFMRYDLHDKATVTIHNS